MTCKDCIHYEVCYYIKQYEKVVHCPDFKDKSQVVDFSTPIQKLYFVKRGFTLTSGFQDKWIFEELYNDTTNCLIFNDRNRALSELEELNKCLYSIFQNGVVSPQHCLHISDYTRADISGRRSFKFKDDIFCKEVSICENCCLEVKLFKAAGCRVG